MKEIILVKYGEIILKGMNRPVFEKKLMSNMRSALSDIKVSITIAQATIYVRPENDSDIDYCVEKLKKVFGIVSIIRAFELPKDIEEIKKGAAECLKDVLSHAKSFKVEAKRSDKRFPFKSPEICLHVGGYLDDEFPDILVDVKNPEVTVNVEIRDEYSYVYAERIAGPQGLPTGTNGKAMLLLSGGIDSPVAGYMVAKRGVELEAIHFFSHPYTSDRAKEKVLDLAKILSEYTAGIKVHIVPFTEIQLKIREFCPEEQLTIIMRRFMMKISEKVAKNNGIYALVTGESIGQVASQTLEALYVTDSSVNIPVFRPVIGMDKEEIVVRSRDIGAYDTSILPYEDCCTVFTPKHPNTKPKLERIIESEKLIKDYDKLIDDAVNGTETLYIKN